VAVPLELTDLEPGDARVSDDLLPVLRELRPHLTAESFDAVFREGYSQGLRFTAAYDGPRCVGVAGWRIVASMYALRKLTVDDLVTTAECRSSGVGHALLRNLERKAREAGCAVLDLDSAVHRHDAHRFYLREGFIVAANHFDRQLTGPENDER
jgi:GNAT superfamily N-acetyltransferase